MTRWNRLEFRHLLAVTTVLVAATIVLGVAARTTGSGLACDANWPVCDGGFLNLLPQGQPSFWEWIHRVVAMVAGFAIIGSALAAWRWSDVGRAIAGLVTLGLVLTPIQVLLGRETVLSYELTILSLHFWTAILIFVLFVVALVLAWRTRLTARAVPAALLIGAATLPVQVILSPLFVQQNTSMTLTIQNGVILLLVGAVILAAMIGRDHVESRATLGVLFATPALTFVVLVLSRESVMTVSATLDMLYVSTVGALLATLLVGAWLTRRDSSTRPDALGA